MPLTELTDAQRQDLVAWLLNLNGSYVVPVGEHCQIGLTLEAVEGGGLLFRFYEGD